VFYVNENGDTVWNTGCGSDSVPENPNKTIKLPDFPVTMSFQKYVHLRTDRCYWDVTLSDIGGPEDGYNVWDGHWVGWCADKDITMPESLQGHPIQIRLWSCYDPALPVAYKNSAWDNISWLVNEYSGSNYVPRDSFLYYFNEAVYCLLGQIGEAFIPPLSQTWVDRAKTEGEGYFPSLPGQYFAVICDAVNYEGAFQPIFIEVDP
jgi:hypothetical protein